MGVCNVLPTVCEAAFENCFSGLKSNRWVGDFQVATGGGFWVATRVKDQNKVTVEQSVEIEEVEHIPPGKEHLPFLLPHAQSCLSYYSDGDPNLFNDLLRYFQRFSYLPEDQWLIIGLYVLQTYLQDHPNIQYMAELLFYAVPERGKSRTGKAVVYVSYRGVHVVDMRESNIFRYSGNLGATIFFDIKDLWKKVERNGSDDIMLLRFEKGARVSRVLYPERGAFKDTVYYSIYGPTIMASNEAVDKILGSRCISFTMPNAPGNYENPTPELGLDLKARLTAWRARMMDIKLPRLSPIPGATGRLWDITMPLFQICKVVCPERLNELTSAILQLAGEKATDKRDTVDGIIVRALSNLAHSGFEHYDIATADLTVEFNKLWQGDKEKKETSIGRCLKALGINTDTTTGRSIIHITRKELDTLMEQHGFLFQSIPEKSSGNSENYNSCINTVSCSLEFIDNERQETQKTPKGNTQGTQQELKAESEANTVSFEYSEFSEYLQGDDHQAQSKEIPLFKVDVPVEVIRS